MPKIEVNRSKVINAPIEEVYKKINDFSHWTTWSPWLIMEPEAKVSISKDKKSYEWEGSRVGAGNMHITSEKENKSVTIDLTFLKPWKSKAKVRFELIPKGDKTEVIWFMNSSLPFFMFWMKKMMISFIGMDYERGLSLLKDYSEDGEVHSKLEFKGESSYPGCQYVGIKTTCSTDAVGDKMAADFTSLEKYTKSSNLEVSGQPISIYHKWDVVKKQVSYTAALPVKNIPSSLPENMVSGNIPSANVYTLRHIGPYHHLGNAWGTLYNMVRNKEIKTQKNIHPFETYVNNPAEVSENELITDICFVLK